MAGVTTVISLPNGGVISLEIAAPSTTTAIFTPKPYTSKRLSSGVLSIPRSTATPDVNQHGATATNDFTTDDVPVPSAIPITTTNTDGQTIVYPLMTTTFTSAEGIYTSVLVAPEPYITTITAGESNGNGSNILHSGILPTSTIIAIVVAFVVGISSIVTASFCVIRSRRRRRRREEAARHVAAEAKKEYDEKLPRSGGATSRVDFGSGADFSASETMSPISPFDDEQRVRYDVPINVVDHSADAASINMENGRAMSMGTERRNRSRHGGNSVPSRARTLDPRRRNDVPLVRELDSDRASARAQVIRTLPIREGDITPYTLPRMPTSTSRSGPPVLNLTIPPDTYHPGRPVPPARSWRRPSDEATVDTLATDDYDVLAEDGSSLARTLTTESGESGTFPATHGMFRSQQGPEDIFRSESPVAWGPGPFGDEYQSSGPNRIGRMARETDFDDASTITEDDAVAPSVPMSGHNAIISGLAPTPTLLTAHASSSGSSDPLSATYNSSLNPFADPTSSSRFGRPRFPPAPQSDAGRSEISSGARTEASFRPGDDARSDVLNLGSRWRSGAQRPMTARNGIAVTYSEDLDAEDDQTTPSDTSRALAPPLPRRSTGDNMSATDEDDYIRTLEGALSGSRKRTEGGREVLQLPPSYDEVFGNM